MIRPSGASIRSVAWVAADCRAKATVVRFGRKSKPDGLQSSAAPEPPPADFVQRIRDELNATLIRAQKDATLPWRDLTQAYLAEMRFHSVAGWLPPAEAARLREQFAREMERLNAVEP